MPLIFCSSLDAVVIAPSSRRSRIHFASDLPDVRFEATIKLNAQVREVIYFGQLPIVDIRGFKSELEDVTHVRSMTTAPMNMEKISREWQRIESIDQLAIRPVLRLTVKSVYPRYEPGTE